MAKTTTKKPAKAPAKRPKAGVSAPAPRLVKMPLYKSFRLQKRIKIKTKRLPPARKLLWGGMRIMMRNWKVFLGITLIYAVLNILLVQGLAAGDELTVAKKSLEEVFTGNLSQLLTGAALFTYILGNSGSTVTPAAGGYQLFIVLVISLATVWALREAYAGHKMRLRDSFYRGMYPFVTFFLVLMVMALQLLPLAGGLVLFSVVDSAGIAASWIETTLWAVIAFTLALFSLYMLCSSIFALYIACLANATPMASLRAAQGLVRGRRWAVVRRVILLPIMLLLLGAVIMIPVILVATPAAPWVFFLLSMMALLVIHAYMYGMYRELINANE